MDKAQQIGRSHRGMREALVSGMKGAFVVTQRGHRKGTMAGHGDKATRDMDACTGWGKAGARATAWQGQSGTRVARQDKMGCSWTGQSLSIGLKGILRIIMRTNSFLRHTSPLRWVLAGCFNWKDLEAYRVSSHCLNCNARLLTKLVPCKLQVAMWSSLYNMVKQILMSS